MIYFFQKGKEYRVIPKRVDTNGAPHYFPMGITVKCVEVFPANSKNKKEFTRPFLAGDFMDSKGVIQTLFTGDVVAL